MRRPGRARPRRRLVRRRAHRLRHPVPAARRALRPARGAARDHHRPLGHAAGRDVLARGRATTRSPTHPALPKPVQAARLPDHHRRRRQEAHPAPRRTVRRRVQPAVLVRRLPRRASSFERVRAACEERGRDPDDLRYSAAQVVCAAAHDEARSRVGPGPSAARSTSCATTALAGHARRDRRQDRRLRRGGADTDLPPGARPVATSTTSSRSQTGSCASSSDPSPGPGVT